MIARISLSVRIRGSARPLSLADQRPLDWRRRLEEMAALFLRFLPRFRQRIGSAYSIDPLRNFVLVGHSYGGMIVKLLLDEASPEMDELSLAGAAATPFYGLYPRCRVRHSRRDHLGRINRAPAAACAR